MDAATYDRQVLGTRETILVVDDDPKIVRLVRTYLEREGFGVVEARDGAAALAAIALEAPDLVVLDVMLPEVDGLSVVRAVRRSSGTPIVMLSARGGTADRIAGLTEGADDYLPKPFSPAELVVRIKRVLERTSGGAAQTDAGARGAFLRHGDLLLDRERHEVTVDGRPVELSLHEFKLLGALLEANGRVLTRDRLLDAMHGPGEGDVLDRTVDAVVKRLREKLGDDADRPRYVATVRGVGYRSAAAEPRASAAASRAP